MPWYVYDFFDHSSADGYWRGSEGAVPPIMVKELAEMIAAKFRIIECNGWASGDYIGGIRVKGGRTCLFRICNGGRDGLGRPHRWILLVALAESAQWRGIDIFEVLESPIFRAYSASAVPSPAPFPSESPWGESQPADSKGQLPDSFIAHGTEADARARDCSRQLSNAPAGYAGILIVQKIAANTDVWFTRESVPPRPLPLETPRPTPSRVPVPVQPILPIEPLPQKRPLKILCLCFVLGFIIGLIVGGLIVWAHILKR